MLDSPKEETMLTLKVLPNKGIAPKQFCLLWFGVSHLSLSEIAGRQMQTGDRRSELIHLREPAI